MTARSKSEIKAFFETGDRPTQAQFEDLVDSYIDTSAAGTVGLRILGAVTSASAASILNLGTLASQNANNISVSGGNLRGVTLSAATFNSLTATSAIFHSPTINTPTVSAGTFAGGTFNSPTINTPTVSGGTARVQTITSATINGSTVNNAPYIFTSYSNPSVGLGTANNYFPISGIGPNPNVTTTAQLGGVVAVGGVLRGFATFLNAAASGGTRTFTVYKNNAATNLVITYGSAELNAKTATGSANIVAGDYLEVLSSVQGAGVNNAGGQFSVFATLNNS